MKTKIFVTGANGLLGSKIIRPDTARYSFIYGFNQTRTNIQAVDSIQVDITKFSDCEKIIHIKPDIIIHTAAITDVDYCEKNKQKAYSVNVLGTRNLCDIAKKIDCKIIYVSTDGVFSGNYKNNKEEDVCNPINYYGQTKLEGENEVRKVFPQIPVYSQVFYEYGIKKLNAERKNTDDEKQPAIAA